MSPLRVCPKCDGEYVGDFCPVCMQQQETVQRPTPGLELKAGDEFRGLKIKGLLGRGGMGAVYRAHQPSLDRDVALKILPPEKAGGVGMQERFEQEAKALASLAHPHIVGVHDCGKEGDVLFFVMELVEGKSLREVLQESKPASEEIRRFAEQICDALEFAHGKGVIHRDIKPENILIDPEGKVKIADFGLAKLTGADRKELNLTGSGMVVGTAAYMAPEQMEDSALVDERADLYSLGVVLYELVTGVLPVGRFEPPSDKDFDKVVMSLLERDPKKRISKAGDVRRMLSGEKPATPLNPKSKPILTVGILLAVCAAVIALVIYLPGDEEKPPPDTKPEVNFADMQLRPGEWPDEVADGRFWGFENFPYRAKTTEEMTVVETLLSGMGFKDLGDLKEAYVLFLATSGMIVLDTDKAGALKEAWDQSDVHDNRWAYHRDRFVILLFERRRGCRGRFNELVAAVQKKIGVPGEPARLTLNGIKLRTSDLSRMREQKVYRELTVPLVADTPEEIKAATKGLWEDLRLSPAEIVRLRLSVFAPRETTSGELVQVSVRFREVEFAVKQEKLLATHAWKGEVEIARVGNVLCVLFSTGKLEPFRGAVKKLRQLMGL